ncbi:hypothetical protein LOC68_15900 [Blastopirellula sp. JC732]|uniref:Uncharacterized protein n=1 Tax=Blastopirellula sediminis TaxID=2894196 RepID=A0A9X1MNE4_9BACT|nr:hypothetical protein [Blastopirellula sediminis]MCC9606829.1 hypothetical protein [Blastopirellula sediminis]MCC9629874.1 hypothetical protein [Blastopirellula sediminis]
MNRHLVGDGRQNVKRHQRLDAADHRDRSSFRRMIFRGGGLRFGGRSQREAEDRGAGVFVFVRARKLSQGPRIGEIVLPAQDHFVLAPLAAQQTEHDADGTSADVRKEGGIDDKRLPSAEERLQVLTVDRVDRGT